MTARTRTVALACLGLVLVGPGCRRLDPPMKAVPDAGTSSQDDPVEEGRAMTEADARTQEARLASSPDDLDSRGRLLGYYARARFRSTTALDAANRHALWVIRNRPESDVAGHPEVMPLGTISPQAAAEARRAWLEAAAAHNTDDRVLEHAAEGLRLYDLAAAEAVLLHLQGLDPDNPKRAEALARHYDLVARWGEIPGLLVPYPADAMADVPAKAVRQWSRYLSRTVKNKPDRVRVLGEVARAELRAGHPDRAEDYAREALANLDVLKNSRPTVAHDAHQVLGLLAARAGDLAGAREHLAESARVGISTQLATKGPSMALARELLARGERHAVLDYLQACRGLWVAGDEELEAWAAQIRAGGTPEFAGRGKL